MRRTKNSRTTGMPYILILHIDNKASMATRHRIEWTFKIRYCEFFGLSIRLPNCLSAYGSICLSSCPSVSCLSVCRAVSPLLALFNVRHFICLSVFLSVGRLSPSLFPICFRSFISRGNFLSIYQQRPFATLLLSCSLSLSRSLSLSISF